MNSSHLIHLLRQHESQGYRVWNAERTIKKGFVASSLKELKARGRDRLDIQLHDACDLKVVLEACGTEVCEESYFQHLSANTLFLLLTPHETWTPASVPVADLFAAKLDTLAEQLVKEIAV